MKLSIAILIFFFGLIFILINQPARAAQTISLEINTQEECGALGGVWNSPQCEGIVPEEAQNLSEIHNPTIGHQVKVNENNGIENSANKPKDIVQPAPPLDAKQTNINKSYLILYLILGLVLLFVFIFLKNKQKNESNS